MNLSIDQDVNIVKAQIASKFAQAGSDQARLGAVSVSHGADGRNRQRPRDAHDSAAPEGAGACEHVGMKERIKTKPIEF